MNVDEVLEAIEQILPDKQFGYVERLVFRQSWLGMSYNEMAEGSGYGSNYIKEIGSQLWQDLSEVLGKRVTKKNLHLVLGKYQYNRRLIELDSQMEFPEDSEVEEDIADLVAGREIEFPGSAMSINSPLYINRPPLEQLVYGEIMQPGCFIRIKAPRKMGKSSLLNRIIAGAKQQGYEAVKIDFQEADECVFASIDTTLRWLCANVSRQLNLLPRLDDYWDEDMGSKVSCKIYFQAYVLEQIEKPFVLTFNEINRVFEHPIIAQDLLPMLRFWHEQSKQEQTWQKLRLVMVHSTEIYIQLHLNQSPFNIGLAICLPPFSPQQVQDLAVGYGLDWARGSQGAQRLEALQAMVGGHPYLVSLAFYHLCRGWISLPELLQAAPTPSGIYSQHLRENLTILQSEPQLASVLKQVLSANQSVPINAIAAYKLESLGLIRLDGNQASPSCELYRLYFQQQLGLEHRVSAYTQTLA
ncbi:MAG: AAA-like domain-containing protein [Rhizonema sp. PD38]|nr:AAA-like domain-containing protein [Rhizonema sp. PD38]